MSESLSMPTSMAKTKSNRALIAMSGGVDSSVAAALMLQKNWDCCGATMRLYDNATVGLEQTKTCCSLDDVEDARAVARRLGIPYYVFNFQDDFEKKVIGNFIASYENGRTPNPCLECNRHLKFEKLLHRAKELDYDVVVTGHYARITYDADRNRYLLKKALDSTKDQSYVLYTLTQEQLAHTHFPLGEMTKDETRALAQELGFINADKKDSQDICFVPDGDYASFIERQTGRVYEPGEFVDQDGKVMGQHRGIIRYTIGQRKGLGLALLEPAYVCALDMEKNQVILGRNEDLMSTEVYANNINLIAYDHLDAPIRCKGKIRYRQTEEACTLYQEGPDVIKAVFDEPQRAVTKGQALVLYDGDTVIGGGTII